MNIRAILPDYEMLKLGCSMQPVVNPRSRGIKRRPDGCRRGKQERKRNAKALRYGSLFYEKPALSLVTNTHHIMVVIVQKCTDRAIIYVIE